MKIHNAIRTINFKSGISRNEIRKYNKMNALYIEEYLQNFYGIDSNFENNRVFSISNLLCNGILKKIGKSKYFNQLNFLSNPGQIRVFDRIELTKNFPDTFCSIVSKKILTNESLFKPRSLFFRNSDIDLEEINEMAKTAKSHGYISSDHFLTFTMHEWLHSIHFEYLYKINNYDEKKVLEYINRLKGIEFSSNEKELVHKFLGDYVYNNGEINPIEVLAEGLNMIVCLCLDKNKLAFKSDIDSTITKLPIEFIELLMKILNFN